jgi:late competence protein required for DNA uptake (superfamily II DNA/RNA helicase)
MKLINILLEGSIQQIFKELSNNIYITATKNKSSKIKVKKS